MPTVPAPTSTLLGLSEAQLAAEIKKVITGRLGMAPGPAASRWITMDRTLKADEIRLCNVVASWSFLMSPTEEAKRPWSPLGQIAGAQLITGIGLPEGPTSDRTLHRALAPLLERRKLGRIRGNRRNASWWYLGLVRELLEDPNGYQPPDTFPADVLRQELDGHEQRAEARYRAAYPARALGNRLQVFTQQNGSCLPSNRVVRLPSNGRGHYPAPALGLSTSSLPDLSIVAVSGSHTRPPRRLKTDETAADLDGLPEPIE